MRTIARLFVLVTFLFALSLITALAQTNANEAQGMNPYDTWHGGELDSVSMTNGGLVLHIPLLSFPQRGNLDFGFTIFSNTKQWTQWMNSVECANQNDPHGCDKFWQPLPRGGVGVFGNRGGAGLGAYVASNLDWIPKNDCNTTPQNDFTGSPAWFDWSASVTAPDGATHSFGSGGGALNGLGCPAPPYRSMDATGFLQLDNNTIAMPNGTRFNFNDTSNALTDTNGNRIVYNGQYTDTIGRVVAPPPGTATTDLSNCPAGTASASVWAVPGLSGGTRTFKFCYSNVSISTNFGNGAAEFGPLNVSLMTAIVLPDLTTWTFAYDNYGEVVRLGFPTGGSISYTYKVGPVSCTDGTSVSRIVTSRTVDANDGTGGHTWLYDYSGGLINPVTHTYVGTNVITGPDGNDIVHTISNPTSDASCSLYDTQVQYFQGSSKTGTLLKTTTTQYAALGDKFGFATPAILPIQESVNLPNGLSTRVVTTWDSGATVTLLGATYNLLLGSRLQEDSYGFDGTLMRSLVNRYLWQDNSVYRTNNLLGLLSSTITQDGAGNPVSKTTFGYDETPVTTSNVVSPSLVTPPAGGNIRGNQTTVSRWLDTNSSFVSSTATYYDTGMRASSVAPKTTPGDTTNRTTAYTYDPVRFLGAYVTQTNLPDTTMPDPGATPVHHVISGDYDFNTGLLTRFTDENGNSFTYDYDPQRLRMSLATHPDGGQTKFLFPNPTTVELRRKIDASRWDDSFVYFDGLGRAIQTQQITPSGTATTDTSYDSMGRVSTFTNPYYLGTNHASDPTYGFTQTLYDALGRTIRTNKQDQSFSTVSYEQSAAFLTNVSCTVATDEAGNGRKTCVDGVGRLVEVDEPSGGSPGAVAAGTITINGALQSTSNGGHGATQAVGSVTINPSTTADRTIQVQNSAATSGSVAITISGSDTFTQGECTVILGRQRCPPKIYDTGSITVNANVGGTNVAATATYDKGSSPGTIADQLASGFGSSFTVGHTAGTNALTLTAMTAGVASNYPISAACSSAQGICGWNEGFTQVASGAPATSFTGGADATFTTIYDTGTATITVNGHADQVTYGQNDNASTIAANLATQINGDTGAFVNASFSGTTVNLTSRSAGNSANVALSSSISYDTSHFSTPILASNNSGTALTGGTDATAGTAVTDSGTVTMTIGTFSTQACYGKSGVCQAVPPSCVSGDSTASQIACILVQGLNGPGSPVKASASGAVISLTYNTIGTAGNGAVTVASTTSQPAYFSIGSFSGAGTLSGGANPVADSLDHPNVTLYQYSARGELLCVHQKAMDTSADKTCSDPTVPAVWRPRNFTYDSFSRLLTSSNPESGVITYNYDNLNLVSRTDARGNTASYTYDSHSRLLDTRYSDAGTRTASYRYDYSSFNGQTLSNPIGRMIAAFVGSDNSTFISYDIMGRATRTLQCTPGVASCQGIGETHDLLGDLVTMSYPGNGFTVTYAYDAAARVISATDSNQFVYAQNPQITAFGAIQQFSTPSFDYKVAFNNRLQPTEIAAITNGTAPQALFDKTYQYSPLGDASPMNNGNIYQVTNLKDDTRTQTFTYDALNRLVSAGDKTHWNNSYTYDSWGNLYGKNPGAPIGQTADTKNRLSGLTYDANGNVTNDGTHRYTYDAENRITCVDPDPNTGQCTATSTAFTYDALGRRISKTTGNNRTNYWYADGQVLAETDSAGNWTNYVSFAGQRIARNIPQSTPQAADIKYYITDHLHSTAVFADKSGSVVDDNDFDPWGSVVAGVGTTGSNNHYKFAGKERDPESGLDYFGARYYSSSMGRFISSDWSAVPAPVPYADLTDPQSLNLYAYVRNNPITRMDPDGHEGDDKKQNDNSATTGDKKLAPENPKPEKWTIDAEIKNGDGSTTVIAHSDQGGSVAFTIGNNDIVSGLTYSFTAGGVPCTNDNPQGIPALAPQASTTKDSATKDQDPSPTTEQKLGCALAPEASTEIYADLIKASTDPSPDNPSQTHPEGEKRTFPANRSQRRSGGRGQGLGGEDGRPPGDFLTLFVSYVGDFASCVANATEWNKIRIANGEQIK